MRPILASLLVLLPACGGEEQAAPPTVAPQPPKTIQIGEEFASDHGVHSVTDSTPLAVIAGDFYFEPTIITGPPGREIDVNLSTDASTTHNFTLPEQGIDQDVEAGGDVTFRVSLPSSGTLLFFCEYHRAEGMLGALQV